MQHFMMVPGLNCTGEVFAPSLQALAGFGHVQLAQTNLGDSLVEIAEALLDAAPDRFALAGFSMGGYIAFEILRQAPERITKLALLSTQAHPDTQDISAMRQQKIKLVRAGRIQPYVPDENDEVLDISSRQRQDLVQLRQRMSAQLGPDVYVQHQTAIMNRIDSRPTLKSIDVPTMILVGENDSVCPPENAALMAQTIPNAQLFSIAHAGHFAIVEQPERCMPAFEGWAKM